MPPIAAIAPASVYRPRRADDALVYRVVAAELDGFLADAEARGHPLPSFVESTFRAFLTCGVLAHGFLRVHCDGCGRDRVVAFSCKRRGVCNSCGGRRMAETAAHLVDHVLPAVPTRQWVLSLPFPLRYRLAYDRTLASPLLAAFLRGVFASLRRRARERYGVRNAKCGAATFLQRFGGALNVNVHFHSLVLDGVDEVLPGSRGIRFLELPPPSPEEIARVLVDTARRIAIALERAGLDSDADPDIADPLARDHPVLAALYAAAVQGRTVTGPGAGRRLARLGSPEPVAEPASSGSPRCATLGGFSLHAGVAIGVADRAGLERLLRYMGRPALACERLELLADGRILYRFRHRWRDGTSALAFEPREFLARLAAQVPPPRAHQVRYHGLLGPCAAWRRYVVPTPDVSDEQAGYSPGCSHRPSRVSRARRMAWSELLRRVFAVDALQCDCCGSRMRVMAAVRSPQGVSTFLACDSGMGRSPPAA
jgi:hypothetical protein